MRITVVINDRSYPGSMDSETMMDSTPEMSDYHLRLKQMADGQIHIALSSLDEKSRFRGGNIYLTPMVAEKLGIGLIRIANRAEVEFDVKSEPATRYVEPENGTRGYHTQR